MTRWTAAAPALARASHPTRPPLLGMLLAAALCAIAPAAHADQIRAFPDAALRGRLEVVLPPAVQLDGKPDQLSMGARIRDTRNLFVTSGTLATGRPYLVNYTRNHEGQISEVWILTAEEAALPRPGAGSPGWFGRMFSF